jgi:hypothetical protein
MAILNQYSLYAMAGNQGASLIDEVDQLLDGIKTLQHYEEVVNYLDEKFGKTEGWKLFNYPNLNKKIAITREDKKVSFCVAKNGKQYYGKYWQLQDE